jgi:hypothetical protein
MAKKCPLCPNYLQVGERVFQFARGRYFGPSITPTYKNKWAVLGEWHEECFRREPKIRFSNERIQVEYRIEIREQEQPYICSLCGDEIERRQVVYYGVIGNKPADPWFRPERRGYDVEFIAHDDCFWQPDLDKLKRAVLRSRRWDGR